jgi:isoleucyl-tRNA synthetase
MKQSKSLGNYVSALEEIHKYGADIIRLWVASVNYQEDMRCSDALISRLQDAYRKIRNTIRYLMSNINDFNPAADSVAYEKMMPIDKWAMQQLQKLITDVTESYENFAFHRVYTIIYNFCSIEMSSIYMDVLKDRMYCDPAKSDSRRSGQTAMYRILDALVKMLAPILVHTAEETYAAMKYKSETVESIHFAAMPKLDPTIDYKAEEPKWQTLMSLRDEVLKSLEGLRKDETIGSNQEAAVTIHTDDAAIRQTLADFGIENFAAMCIVSEIKLEAGNGQPLAVARKSPHKKCQRCWNYWPTVGTIADDENLCKRCAESM